MNSTSSPTAPTVQVHLTPSDLDMALRDDVVAGLSVRPRELPPKWLYDDLGCALFDEITRLPEYYPTRAERSILVARADDIAKLSGADTLVELGSGTSEKTRLLLDAMLATGSLRRFVPFDVAEGTLRESVAALTDRYPSIEIHGVVGDFERHIDEIPRVGTRLIAFLGGTIGNLHRPARATFLERLVSTMRPGDSFLLGTDLVKDRDRLVAAYDDSAGVTARFNLNVLTILNRELGADFRPAAFDHVARFDETESFIEMRLRSKADQRVTIDALDLVIDLAAGEEVRTEISTKFQARQVRDELETAGLAVTAWWTDEPGDFALWLATR